MAALVIAIIALGGNFFVLATENSQISQNNSALSTQIAGLEKSLNSLQTAADTLQSQLSQSQQAQSAQSQQVSILKENLTNVQSELTDVASELSSNSSSGAAFQSYVYAQLAKISTSLQSLTDRLDALAPQVPLSTLVITGDNFSKTTDTFTFSVENTLDVTVYAQIDALLYGTTTRENCDFVAGTYISQMYTFQPDTATVTTLALASGLYNGCAGNPVSSLSLYYMVPPSTAVSLTYQFNVVPGYNYSGYQYPVCDPTCQTS